MINIPTTYELEYPITKTPGPWLIVGCTMAADGSHIHSLDIHLNADDPNFNFLKPEDYPDIPAKLIKQFNFPHTKEGRLLLRRTTNFFTLKRISDEAEYAGMYIVLHNMKKIFPKSNITVISSRHMIGCVHSI